MNRPEPLWDDTYDGQRWTYGLTYRPLAMGAVPDGWIITSNRAHPEFHFGTVDYPFPISHALANAAEITFIGTAGSRAP